MRHFGTANVTRGSIAWSNPLRLRIRLLVRKEAQTDAPAQQTASAYVVDRDRIFEYLKTHRLPGERARQLRRDARNRVDFIADLRELQTPADVRPR
jgi:hypothetical protein